MGSIDGEIPAVWFLISSIGFIILSLIQYRNTGKSINTIFLSVMAILFLLSYFILLFKTWFIPTIHKKIRKIKNRLKSDTFYIYYLLNSEWIKRQLLTGQLDKSREVQFQGAESFTKHRWTCEAGGMAVAHQRRAKTTVLCTLKSARKQGFSQIWS